MDYSKIYIDADCSMHELENILYSNKDNIFGNGNHVRVFVDKNDSTDAERREPRAVFSPAIRATFYLEVYTKEEGDTIEFKERVAQFKESRSLSYSFASAGLMSLPHVILKILLLKRPVGTGRKKSRCHLQ